MLASLSLLLIFTVIAFASFSMAMTIRGSWTKIVLALQGAGLPSATRRYEARRVRPSEGWLSQPTGSSRLREAA